MKLSDDNIRQLRPNPKLDRASQVVTHRDMNMLLDELLTHRAMVRRLEEWADLLDCQLGSMSPHHQFAAALRNKMKGPNDGR